MHTTKPRVFLGALATLCLMLGLAAFAPIVNAEAIRPAIQSRPAADRTLAHELGDLSNVSLDRNNDSIVDYTRNCTVTQRVVTDADGDGNAEFVFIEIVCRETADLNFNGTTDAWRVTTANYTQVDRNDDGNPELKEV